MEERSNKTIMCSVLFLDIVEYSKKSVSGQISLKDRFNSYLSEAISDVPMTDRIILDTGDGAAINFLGDVEDALKAALSLRESLLNEDPDVDHPLLVRMGINLGPVRLVRDINGQPNIVGDGINVAQRVMGFADAAQILVSRSYYDAVSRLSPQYAGMFHYQGSRTDKHVREHEVYAIGYPGDKTTLKGKARPGAVSGASGGAAAFTMQRVQDELQSFLRLLDDLSRAWMERYRQAGPGVRVLYMGAVVVPVFLGIALLVYFTGRDKPAPGTVGQQMAESAVPPALVAQPAAATASAKAAAPLESAAATKPDSSGRTQGSKSQAAMPSKRSDGSRETPRVKSKDQPKDVLMDDSRPSQAGQAQPKSKPQADVAKKPAPAPSGSSTEARVSVDCTPGTEVFVDGVRKGSVGSRAFTIVIAPGTHTVIVSHTSGGIYSQSVNASLGKTVEIRPSFCR